MVVRSRLLTCGERELTTPGHLTPAAFEHQILLVLSQSLFLSANCWLLGGCSQIITAQNRLFVLLLYAQCSFEQLSVALDAIDELGQELAVVPAVALRSHGRRRHNLRLLNGHREQTDAAVWVSLTQIIHCFLRKHGLARRLL